jgi:ubiquinone/menaquinone biosynthesis C-methylase UbiE
MASDYEIETPEYLAHGIKAYQIWMFADSEDQHIEICSGLAEYKRGMRICDMGCGVGYIAHLMNLCGFETVGVTNSRFQHDYAAEHFPETRFLLCDMTDTPLQGESFDAVQWMESIGYVDQTKAFSEAFRLLKSGGRAVCKDFAAIRDPSLAGGAWSYRFVSAGEMINRAEDAGLKLIKAFSCRCDSKRYETFFSDSKLMQALHPAGCKAHASIPFWYEFVKL